MGLMDRVKQNIADTVELAREGVDQVSEFREKREVAQLYGDLGKKVFELVEKGELELPDSFGEELREIRRTIADREYIKGSGSSRPAAEAIPADPAGTPGAPADSLRTRDDI